MTKQLEIMRITRTVHPTDKATNFDEVEAKKLKQHNITKVDNYVFSLGASQSKNTYIPKYK